MLHGVPRFEKSPKRVATETNNNGLVILFSPGHIGFGVRVESAAETTAKAFQSANTGRRDVDPMPVEVLRG